MFFFLSGWNLSFRGRQSTVSMVFSRALTEKVPSSLNEGRRKSTRMISHDDHAFNFIYLIKMKDYIVKTTRSLRAEWVRAPGGVLPYITYTGMCRPTGSWFWSSWFRTEYPFQRRFLERGIIFRAHESSSTPGDYEEAFIWCISRTNKEISFLKKKSYFNLQTF